MHYGHIASDKGASIDLWKEFVIFRYSSVDLTKRTFQLAIWSVNDSHFVNYGMIFVFRRIGVVYKSNYNLKTNRQNWLSVFLG